MPLSTLQGDALFRTLIVTAVDGIIVTDANGTIAIYNAACERLFGYRPEEVIGHNVKMLMPAPYHDEHDAYLANYRKTGERRIIGVGREVVGQRRDGSTFPMYLSVGEGTLDGEKIYVGIIHDLTSYQEAQLGLREREAQRRLQELQSELLHVSRLSAMGQMASALAHELNQPLSAIANYVKAAHRMLAAVDDPRTGRIQDIMVKASEQTIRAGEIIRRLRDYVEKRQTTRTWENLNKVVEEALALGLIGAAETNVKVRATLDPALPPIAIDKVQIQQVLVNLIRNAIEAMHTAPTRVLSITTRPDEDHFVQVAVADTGVGLADEVAAKLFQPFVTTKKAGMGVGLTICQSIIEGHGGRIWATANESGGVSFRFRLPARKPNEAG